MNGDAPVNDVGHSVRTDRVAQRLAQRLVELIAGAQRAAIGGLDITGELRVIALQGEDIEAGGELAIEEVRLGEAQIDLARAKGDRRIEAQILALAEQVALMDADIGERTVRGRIADADLELAGRLLLDIGMDDRLVGRAAGRIGDIDLLEEAEIVDALLGAVELRRVERIAFDQAELAADDAVLRAEVAGDVDALDINLRTFLHVIGDVDRMGVGVALDRRIDLHEGIAAIAERVADGADRAVDQIGVVPIALARREQRLQHFRVDVFQRVGQVDLAEMVARAFLDGEGDEEARAIGRQLGDRRDDAEIGIALRQIEFAQQLAVIRQAIRIVGVVAREEAPPARLLRRDDVAQRRFAELVVAEEGDAADAGRWPFVDLEDEVDAVLRQLDHFRLHRRGEVAGAAIELENADDVSLHLFPREDETRTELDLAVEVVVRELRIALELDAVDDRVLDHVDDQRIALALHAHVGEQAGGIKSLQRSIELRRVVDLAGLNLEVGADGVGIDALRAVDANLADDIAGRSLRNHVDRGHGRGQRDQADDESNRKSEAPGNAENDPQLIPPVPSAFRAGSGGGGF